MKKLLFIGWDYQIYTREMIEEFQLSGYDVTFYNVVSFSPAMKLRNLISKKWDKEVQHSRHQEIIVKEKDNKYDIVFLLLPFFSFDCLQNLRNDHPQAKFILYLWDAANGYIRKGINISDYLGCFDKAYTFDRQDAIQYGINYLPLFCVRKFQNLKQNEVEWNNVYMVGNLANFRRYDAIKQFEEYCKKQQISFNWYLKGTLRKNIKVLLQGKSLKYLHTSSISNNTFIDMMQRSSTVFDFANHIQDGYTMRVMENLCAGKKIITNNRNVLNEPFYSPDRFFVYDDLDFNGVKEFLKTPLSDPSARFEEFYLSSFIKKLVSE